MDLLLDRASHVCDVEDCCFAVVVVPSCVCWGGVALRSTSHAVRESCPPSNDLG
jgi:hypothetical protein